MRARIYLVPPTYWIEFYYGNNPDQTKKRDWKKKIG